MNDQELRKILDDIPKQIVSGLKPVLEAITTTAPEATNQSGIAKLGKWVGLIGGILAILASTGITLNYIVSNAIDKSLSNSLDSPQGIRAQIASLRSDYDGIHRDVNRLLSWYDHQIFSSGVSGAAKGASPEDINGAAERLRSSNTVIPVDQIQRVSTPLFHPPVTPAKWEAVIQLANLRSFVNSTLEYAKQHTVVTVHAGQDGRPGSLIPAHKADEWVELVGGSVILDGTKEEQGSGLLLTGPNGDIVTTIGNLVIKDSTVRYRGGKVTLINVFFENCTFDITNNDNGISLARNLLDPSPFTRFVAN